MLSPTMISKTVIADRFLRVMIYTATELCLFAELTKCDCRTDYYDKGGVSGQRHSMPTP